MANFMDICEKAARAGGDILLEWQHRVRAREKGPKDLVTEADEASQARIREIILDAFPDHQFLGEEDPAALEQFRQDREQFWWIVDPLDGTVNYVHGLPNFSVSVALVQAGRPIVGVVWDPLLGECFQAERGEGAMLNRAPLRCSLCDSLPEALVAASFSSDVPRNSPEIPRFVEMLHHCRAVRRMGSAALNLAYVAAGRLDGYWATSVKCWDVAAGALLVEEAGGTLTHFQGTAFDLASPQLLAAANAPLHTAMREVLHGESPSI